MANRRDVAFGLLDLPERPAKPRRVGLTIVNDRCLSLRQVEDLLEVNADIIDCMKLVDHAGMPTRYPAEWLRRKLSLCASHGILTFPGGLSFEIAESQGKAEWYLERVRELGFSGVEISDDLIPRLDLARRSALIRRAKEFGFTVFTELGKKLTDRLLDVAESVEFARADLGRGVDKIAVEIADLKLLLDRGRMDILLEIIDQVGMEPLCLEAGPGGWPTLHARLITTVGKEVNLENVEASEVDQIEAMRRGVHRSMDFPFLSQAGGKVSA